MVSPQSSSQWWQPRQVFAMSYELIKLARWLHARVAFTIADVGLIREPGFAPPHLNPLPRFLPG